MSNYTVGFIGGGNMTRAIAAGLIVAAGQAAIACLVAPLAPRAGHRAEDARSIRAGLGTVAVEAVIAITVSLATGLWW